MRSGGGRALLVGGLLSGGLVLVGLGVGIMVWFGPSLRRDMALDRVVKVAAISWAMGGEDSAREELSFGLASSGFGSQSDPDEMCVFEQRELERVLVCEWEERVRLPVIDVVVPLVFHSEATLDATGDVR